MTRLLASLAIGLLTLLGHTALGVSGAIELAENPRALIGTKPTEDPVEPPEFKSINTQSGRFERAYRQQPPMIPHRIDAYQVDIRVNQCMTCHDWPHNVAANAPKISETHYVDRNGIALDHVARNRWFCTQCHVVQVNAPTLVNNRFRSAKDVD